MSDLEQLIAENKRRQAANSMAQKKLLGELRSTTAGAIAVMGSSQPPTTPALSHGTTPAGAASVTFADREPASAELYSGIGGDGGGGSSYQYQQPATTPAHWAASAPHPQSMPPAVRQQPQLFSPHYNQGIQDMAPPLSVSHFAPADRTALARVTPRSAYRAADRAADRAAATTTSAASDTARASVPRAAFAHGYTGGGGSSQTGIAPGAEGIAAGLAPQGQQQMLPGQSDASAESSVHMLRSQLASLQRLREDNAARTEQVSVLQAEAAELRASRDDAANLRQQVALLEDRVASRDAELQRKDAELAAVRRTHAGSELELRGQVAAAEAAMREGAATMALLHGEAEADVLARAASADETAAAAEARELRLRQEGADAQREIARLQGVVSSLEAARATAGEEALRFAREEAELARLRRQEGEFHELRGVAKETERELAAERARADVAEEARAAAQNREAHAGAEAETQRAEADALRRRLADAALAETEAGRVAVRLETALEARHSAQAKLEACERAARERGRADAAAAVATADLRRELETLCGLLYAGICAAREGGGSGGNGTAADVDAAATPGGTSAAAAAMSWRLQEACERTSAAHRNWEGMLAQLLAVPVLAPLTDALVDLRGGMLGALRLLHEAHRASARLGAAGRQSDAVLAEYRESMAALEAEALAALLHETSAAQHELDGVQGLLAAKAGSSGSVVSPAANEQQRYGEYSPSMGSVGSARMNSPAGMIWRGAVDRASPSKSRSRPSPSISISGSPVV